MTRSTIGLDNPVFAGRTRTRRLVYKRRPVVLARGRSLDVVVPNKPKKVVAQKQTVKPALPRQTKSQVLRREIVKPSRPTKPRRRKFGRSLQSRILTIMAMLLFLCGVGVGVYSLRTNRKVEAQVRQISKVQTAVEGSDASTSAIPAQTPPPANSIANYQVAATLPRVIRIPKLGVEARVTRVSAKADSELGVPGNIFDTGWYDGSAKLGDTGATLLDGHVSGPTQNGVFYGIKTLKPGDQINVERGDGKIFNYKVVTSKTYAADSVDMSAALAPITPGKSGLNLITCTGQLDRSTSEFKQRVVVFAEQI